MIYRIIIAAFAVILVSVSVVAAVAGENDRLGRQAVSLANAVTARDYRAAYRLLADDVQQQIDFETFARDMRVLRDVFVDAWGAEYSETIAFRADHPRWYPWSDGDRMAVSIAPVAKEEGWKGELRKYLGRYTLAGDPLEDLVTVTRVGTRWEIASIKKFDRPVKDRTPFYVETDDGFAFRGFRYSPEMTDAERAAIVEDLERALAAIHADDPDAHREEVDALDLLK